MTTETKLLPPIFKKGTRVSHTDKRTGETVYGTVKSVQRKAPFKVVVILDGGEYQVSGPFFVFKETDVPAPKDEPSVMDRWGVTGYHSCGGDETECFEAGITLNGKRVGRARNDGNGGCNSYMGTDSYCIPGFETDAVAWARQFGWEKPFEAADMWIDWYVKFRPYGVTAKKYIEDFLKKIS